jgi:hypothetical protein
MADPMARPTRASRWRRVKLIGLLGLLLTLLAYVTTDALAGRSLDAELARLEPLHGNLRVRTFAARSVPAADNRARLVSAAMAIAIPAPWALNESIGRFGSTGDTDVMPPDLRAFVEQNREAIQFAARIGTRPKASWDIDYGGGGVLPWLEIRNLVNLLYLNAMLELEAKRPDEAAHMIATGLAVSSSLNNEPQLIAPLVRMGMAERQFMALQRLLRQSEPSKAALEDLARWLTENRPDPSRIGLESELAYASTTMVQMEEGRADLLGNQFPGSRVMLRIIRPFVRLAHVRLLRSMDRLIANQAGPRPRPAWEAPKAEPWWPIRSFVSGTFSGLARTVQTGDDYMSMLGASEIAVALRRHKLDHGTYPTDLAALVPTYLDQLSVNPYTGAVPVYARAGDGFTLRAPRDEKYPSKGRPTTDWKVAR